MEYAGVAILAFAALSIVIGIIEQRGQRGRS